MPFPVHQITNSHFSGEEDMAASETEIDLNDVEEPLEGENEEA